MTKIKNNPLLKGLSGKFGETHIYREVRGQMQMVNVAAKKNKMTASQKTMSEKLKGAATYWKSVKKVPEILKGYQERTTSNEFSAYLVASKDYMNAPVVHYIKTEAYKGAIGDTIIIKATDDFKVTRVSVSIKNITGKTIEKGDAMRAYSNKPQIFKYVAKAVNKNLKGTIIHATAWDLPENDGSLKIVI